MDACCWAYDYVTSVEPDWQKTGISSRLSVCTSYETVWLTVLSVCSVSCMIWEPSAVHKVDLTVLDIGWTIMQKVDKLPETCDYLVLGIVFSLLIMFTPTFYRIYHSKDQLESLDYHQLAEICMAAKLAFGHNWRLVAAWCFSMFLAFCILNNTVWGPVFPSPIKSNLICLELIVDQLCFVFPGIFDLQLRDRWLADPPSTEPTLCQSDWLTVTSVCGVALYPACAASGCSSQ